MQENFLITGVLYYFRYSYICVSLVLLTLTMLLSLRTDGNLQAGLMRAEKRHEFMEEFLKQFYAEWDGKA